MANEERLIELLGQSLKLNDCFVEQSTMMLDALGTIAINERCINPHWVAREAIENFNKISAKFKTASTTPPKADDVPGNL